MKYQVQMTIHKERKTVTESYINRADMLKWEKGLNRIEDTKGILFEENSEGFLVFKFNDQEMKMKVTVEEIKTPELMTMIYELPGAWNRCVNQFKEINGNTIWTMDVTFIFENEMDVPLVRFIEKTEQGMKMFKDFVEGI